jgi:hypothetical protein
VQQIPPAQRPPKLSFGEFAERYRQLYLKSREDSAHWEWLAVLTSIGGYIWFVAAALARPPDTPGQMKPRNRRRT